jgi:hypothetical protein
VDYKEDESLSAADRETQHRKRMEYFTRYVCPVFTRFNESLKSKATWEKLLLEVARTNGFRESIDEYGERILALMRECCPDKDIIDPLDEFLNYEEIRR